MRTTKDVFNIRTQPRTFDNILSTDQTEALFKQGVALHHQGQLAQAQELYRNVTEQDPRHFEALHLLGVIAAQSKNHTRAVDLIGKSLEIYPGNAVAHANLGNALKDLGQHQAAIGSYDKAIALKPDYAKAYLNRGIELNEMKRHRAAVDSFNKAIALRPDMLEAYFYLANALSELSQYQAAVDNYRKVIAFKPDAVEAYYNCGTALQKLKLNPEAIENYDKVIAIQPNAAAAYYNRGLALYDLNQFASACESYDQAIAIDPNAAASYYNRGLALSELKKYQAAIADFDKTFAIDPDHDFLLGTRFHTKIRICDWQDAKNEVAALLERIHGGFRVGQPFSLLALTASPTLQREAAEIWVKEWNPFNSELGAIPKRSSGNKIRIGYFSADFHNHATAYLMAGLFEQHDREKFELIAFSFGPNAQDEMRSRISAAFDKFIDVRRQSDREIALLSRSLGIDIAIDLKGFTTDNRIGIFALRAAPIQVNYLGYPGTMGADYMDYLIADRTLIPQESRQHYSERIVYLANSYQVNDAKRKIADKVFTREELGLPETGFVFCCFNNNYKITPDTFGGWMRILKQVDASVLWLLEDNPIAAGNLRKEAQQRGVDSRRLVFAKRMPLPEHLARHRAADLFIDTLPYNAHTTASDALWAGLPVLTCTGEAFASRVAASLLSAIDLSELITSTQEDYETLAVEIALHPEKLKAIKQKLERNRLGTPLFDTKLFARNIEDAYTQMVSRYQAGLPPEHIYVAQ